MNYQNPIKKKLSKKNRKVSFQEPSELLAEFFSGEVIKLDEKYRYET